jgi:Kef-type K+ transport system membrane component KefB/predicted anti-sigma-YlaC factor YlaD
MDFNLQIFLFLALLVGAAKALGGLSIRLGLPVVLGELLAGVIFSPTVLGVLRYRCFTPLAFAPGGDAISLAGFINGVAQLSVVVLMFLAGLETNLGVMKKALDAAFWAASGGVVLPLAGGMLVAHAFGYGWAEAVFVGTVLTATSVSVTAQTLTDFDQLDSKLGTTILGAAVIDDVLGLAVLSVVLAAELPSLHPRGWSGVGVVLTLARLLLFILATIRFGPTSVGWTMNQARRLFGSHADLAASFVIAFLFAFLAQSVAGLAPITGAYAAGLLVASTPSQAEVMSSLRSVTQAFFAPVFFASVGLGINAREWGGQAGFFASVLAVAVLGKVLGCGAGARMRGFSGPEALQVGLGMVPRGEVGLITASIGWTAGLISSEVYSMMIVLVLVTTLLTPILLRIFSKTRMTVGAALAGALLLLVTNTGCAMKKIAVNKIGDAIANGGTVYASDNDPELVRDAVPFSLKLIESLLEESPRHRGLLLAASKGFTEYGYAFIQEGADEMEGRDLEAANAMHTRARQLYLRARDYGLRGLEARHRGFEKGLREDPKGTLRRVTSAKEVPLVYWTAASWGLAISLSKDKPDLVADQPAVEAMIDRALQLDEGFGEGAIHSFLIAYEPSRQGAKGDPLVRSRKHFERAIELSRGQLAGPYVSLAENVCVQRQDKQEFQSLLERALAIDVDAHPESRLENLVMQRRARWLLSRTSELFADGDAGTNAKFAGVGRPAIP